MKHTTTLQPRDYYEIIKRSSNEYDHSVLDLSDITSYKVRLIFGEGQHLSTTIMTSVETKLLSIISEKDCHHGFVNIDFPMRDNAKVYISGIQGDVNISGAVSLQTRGNTGLVSERIKLKGYSRVKRTIVENNNCKNTEKS